MGERNISRSLWHGGIQKWHRSNCHKNTITVTVPLYYIIGDQQDRVVGCCSFHLLATVKDNLQIWSCSGLIYFCGWCQNVGNMNQIGYIYYALLMDSMALFTMGTGGHYITMQPADWSIFTSHDPLPSSCHSEKMLWNPSINQVIKICLYLPDPLFLWETTLTELF